MYLDMSKKSEHEKRKQEYLERFKDYSFYIFEERDGSSFNPNNVLDVRLITRDGKEYSADFVTMRYLYNHFLDGEVYFCTRGFVVVQTINNETIKKTIDDLITKLSVEHCFKELEKSTD